ncbi:hypothetical protein HPP92_011306 [Vanilla planifolia]|uniref:Phosphatidylinositol 4-phosphate 5-kinase n=1 Tax=Vanilla planifolia TaxID=51239 RepID=A0A835QYT3_VANPL|nr:hypothetical protein HPP92_011306 [Vanilla planifolia]
MSAVATDDESDDHSLTPRPADEEVQLVERLLPGGDFYTGQWCGDVPHGTGKYLWTDGCMYEGEWWHGRTMGRGKFSWPSGATYEGEFKSGFMDGHGTYTGAGGDTYRGAWSLNLKHGPGHKYYANGDSYDGEWRAGLQDGHGRYVWKSGSEYAGHWRTGRFHGRGSLIWASGNRYDGGWEGGFPRGNGSFRWADGSLYIGIWAGGGAAASQQKGVYYPSPSANSPAARDPGEALANELADCYIAPDETISILPSQKTLSWTGIEADFLHKQALWRSAKSIEVMPRRHGSVDAAAAAATTPTRRPNGHAATNTVLGFDRMLLWESDDDANEGNKPVERVWEGGESPPVGIEMASNGGEIPEPTRTSRSPGRIRWVAKELKKQGDTISKGHKNYDLMLNLQLGIRLALLGKIYLLLACCGKQALATSLDLKPAAFDPKEKVWTRFPPEGSKHTPPHQSCDFRWKDYCPLVFRTLRKLFKVDPGDYMISICGNDALRELSSPGKSGSFFYLTNDDKYMIKTMKKSEVKVLLRMLQPYYNHIRLQRSWFQEFCRQVDRDCDFLEQERIMDYSLLVGVHFRDVSVSQESQESVKEATPRLSRTDMAQYLCDPTRWAAIKLGANMPARVEKIVRKAEGESLLIGEPTGEFYDVILFFGIIDILQDYDISKKLEHAYKSIQFDPTSISAVDPKQYSKRFRDFIYRAFTEDL